jgi:hypothetical protein
MRLGSGIRSAPQFGLLPYDSTETSDAPTSLEPTMRKLLLLAAALLVFFATVSLTFAEITR